MGDEGEGLIEHLTKKYGASATKSFGDPNSSMARMGRAVGINFNNDRKIYNTKKAHALVEHIKATDNDKANELMENLYGLYFEKGDDISDMAKLLEAAEKVGISADEAKAAMVEKNQVDVVKKDRLVKSQWGVSGVPYYVIEQNNGGKPVAFSGAYPVDFIADELEKASA